MSDEGESRLRAIPPTQRLLQTEGARALAAHIGEDALRDELRAAIDSAREALIAGSIEADRAVVLAHIDARLSRRATAVSKRNLRPVINATGVILHTNLGRAPLGDAVLDDVRAACRGYAALEYDIDLGARGHRDRVVKEQLVRLTGAEDALVVNNCAAAVLLACTALAAGREVIVSRGELVEIGGGFRIPDVIASCGATLVEVGTTNKTRATDFAKAITDRTAAILSVHPSNFSVLGFTERASREALAKLANEREIAFLEDLGSGALIDLALEGLPHEPTAREAVEGGAHVVMFSGDKLLGGPQAGILAGKSQYISRLRAHPLLRALRPGRIVLAALEATLARYASGRWRAELPALRALTASVDTVTTRASALKSLLSSALTAEPNFTFTVEPSIARVGGGTLPLAEIPSAALVVRSAITGAITDVERALRAESEPPIVGRVTSDALWLDARTLEDHELAPLAAALARALSRPHMGDAASSRGASDLSHDES